LLRAIGCIMREKLFIGAGPDFSKTDGGYLYLLAKEKVG